MFTRLGGVVSRFRWTVIAIAGVVVALGVGWGASVFGSLKNGGFNDPNSESTKARERIESEVGRDAVDVLALYSSPNKDVDDPAFRREITDITTQLDANADVATVLSYYQAPAPDSPLVSSDRHATYLAIQLTGDDENDRLEQFRDIEDDLEAATLKTEIGGPVGIFDAINSRISADIARAEMIAMPIVFVLSLFIFGGLIAALMPTLVGAIAVVGALLVTKIITSFTDMSVFSINVIMMLGLGLAIDYSLFIVKRFREELETGVSSQRAAVRAVATAGRTVAVSGITVMLSLAGLLIFPQLFLRSMGIGGIAAVGFALLASVTVLPAVLALLGQRINSLRIPLPRRKSRAAGTGMWARLAGGVMRRPVLFTLGALAVLLVLAAPFRTVVFGGVDERMLPAGTESREVTSQLHRDFQRPPTTIDVLVSNTTPDQAAEFAQRIAGIDNVESANVARERANSALVTVTYDGQSTDVAARDIVTDIRALAPPAGADVMVAGPSAELVDLLDSLGERLPIMALVVATITALLLAFAFGSILLPLKAVLLNVVSLGASFGVVTYIFQDGHFADFLGFTPTGTIEATQPILMVAILFGLSMDYELFLLSRIREEWDATGDNTAAVSRGLQRTGGIITSAALLLIIVVAGFAAGGITLIKMVGVGMIVAIIVDATIVRILLVPASMRLLGQWNWWLPGPLARWDARRRARKLDVDQPVAATPAVAEPQLTH